MGIGTRNRKKSGEGTRKRRRLQSQRASRPAVDSAYLQGKFGAEKQIRQSLEQSMGKHGRGRSKRSVHEKLMKFSSARAEGRKD